jgi:hypothetical protein
VNDTPDEGKCVAEGSPLRKAPTEPRPRLQGRHSVFAIAFPELLTEPISFQGNQVPAQTVHRSAIVTDDCVDAAQVEVRVDFETDIAAVPCNRQGLLARLDGAVLLPDEE